MQAIPEPYIVKITSPAGRNHYSSGTKYRRKDRGTPEWLIMQTAWHKRGVIAPRVLNLASGYEPANELKDTRLPTSTSIGIYPRNLNTPHHKKQKAGDILQGDRESNGKERGMEKKRVEG